MKSIPLHSLVLMIGPNTSDRLKLVQSHFQSYEIIDVDDIKHGLVGDRTRCDLNDISLQEANHRAHQKLKIGERAVINAPNLHYKDRMAAASIGINLGVPTFYVVVNESNREPVLLDEKLQKQMSLFSQIERDVLRGDHQANVVDTRIDSFSAVDKLPSTGILEHIKSLGYNGLCIVPDVHGVLESLKQAVDWARARGLFLVFLGDVIDYGPNSIECVYIVYDLVMRGRAIFTIGNHEKKIERWIDQQRKLLYNPHALKGKTPIRLSEGNKATTMVIESMSHTERNKFESRFKALIAHSRNHWLLGDEILVTHAACEPEMFEINTPRLNSKLEAKTLYGEIDQKTPTLADGYPNRIYNWVNRIPSGKTVLVGHDIRSTVKPLLVCGSQGGSAYFMDTGSGKGGRLTTADIVFRNERVDVQNFTAH